MHHLPQCLQKHFDGVVVLSPFHQVYNKNKAQIDRVYAILKKGDKDEEYAQSVLKQVKCNSLFKKLEAKMLHITE